MVRLSIAAEKESDIFKGAHLLWRAGLGGTWEEIEALFARGLKARVAYIPDLPELLNRVWENQGLFGFTD